MHRNKTASRYIVQMVGTYLATSNRSGGRNRDHRPHSKLTQVAIEDQHSGR